MVRRKYYKITERSHFDFGGPGFDVSGSTVHTSRRPRTKTDTDLFLRVDEKTKYFKNKKRAVDYVRKRRSLNLTHVLNDTVDDFKLDFK